MPDEGRQLVEFSGLDALWLRGLRGQGEGRAGWGELVEDVPPGFTIRESVNGVVSLARDRLSRLRPAEVAAVEAAVRRHRQGHPCRVAVTPERIDVYERVGPDLSELLADLGVANVKRPEQGERLHVEDERRANYTPVLRFVLADPDEPGHAEPVMVLDVADVDDRRGIMLRVRRQDGKERRVVAEQNCADDLRLADER